MKNSEKVFILFCSLLTFLAGCSSELTEEKPGPEKPTDDRYYLSFALDMDNALATTRAFTGTDEGTYSERCVQNVRIVLYDGEVNSSKVVRAFNYNIKSVDGATDKWSGSDLAPTTDKSKSDRFITYAREVSATNYKLLAIINPTTDMKTATAVGKSLEDFTQAKVVEGDTKSTNVGGMAQNNSFVMTNSKRLVTVTAQQILNSEDEAHANPIAVNVERVVAKVTLQTPTKDNQVPVKNTGAEVSNLTWGLDITNKKTYWMRKGTENGSTDRSTWYSEDPNWSGTSSYTEASRRAEFFYYLSQNTTPALPYTLNGSEYCLENTMSNGEQNAWKVITRVLIRCTYKPSTVTTLGEGYYVVLNNLDPNAPAETYTEENMKTLVQQAKDEQKTIDGPSRISELVLNAMNAGYDLSTGGVPRYGGQVVTSSFETNSIRYYYQGVNYYGIKVLHFGEQDTTNPMHGHYGVLRNTHYTVVLERINGSGAVNLQSSELSTRSGLANDENSIYSNITATVTHTR